MRLQAARWFLYLAFACASAPPQKLPLFVAVLPVSSHDASEVIAVETDLEMLGIPFETAASVDRAVKAPMLVVAGTLANTALSPADRERLYSFVEAGGVLFATQVQGSQFFPLFGITGFSSTRENYRLHFADRSADLALHYVNRPEEQDLVLGNPHRYKLFNWTTQYKVGRAAVLATFPGGAAAFIRNYYGRGIAYSLGLSFTDSSLRPALGQSQEAEPQWANVFAPAADVPRLLLRAIYESNVHPFILIHTIPNGLETALLLSHDLDARESFHNSVAFARLEQRFGTTSTFFVTTKYFSDTTDTDYYTSQNCAYLREVAARGFDLGSHTVSHLKTFHRFPLGEPLTRFATYHPAVAPTVFGEIVVSKELLERDIPGQHTISFRAGELSHPPQLIRALQATGYVVDSTRAAGNTLTNYPYRPLLEAHVGAAASGIIEVPVTLDDSQGYLTAANLDAATSQWLGIVAANAENNNVTCLLIHPTDVTFKLTAEERLLQVCRQKSVWIDSVTRFGLFARSRASVRVGAFSVEHRLLLRLNQRRSDLPEGLTLVIEDMGGRWPDITVQDNEGAQVPTKIVAKSGRKLIVLQPRVAPE
jgi:hypothetical protein